MLSLILLLGAVPIFAAGSGIFIGKSPRFLSTQNGSCPDSEKDSGGKCPSFGSSNFRYLGIG